LTSTVVLLSGGMDSSTLLAKCLHEGFIVNTLGFDYGQTHSIELAHAAEIARYYGVSFHVIKLDGRLFWGAKSSQIGSSQVAVPEGHYAEESMKATIVPNRNMLMLASAGTFALSNGIRNIAYAAHAGDHTIYPDCRSTFITPMRDAFRNCDWNPITLQAPFLNMTKADIVTLGIELGVPYGATYSCYKGAEGSHCGVCGTCVERKEAFKEAGHVDPTRYESVQ
jgi:7-cyano-7-deazaguanine synthase